MATKLGLAVGELRKALAHLVAVPNVPAATYSIREALHAITTADADDMDRWLDEHCQRCGELPADVLVEVARHTTPLCARCATVTAQEDADERAEFGGEFR